MCLIFFGSLKLNVAFDRGFELCLSKNESYDFVFDIFDFFNSVDQNDFLNLFVVFDSGDFVTVLEGLLFHIVDQSVILIAVFLQFPALEILLSQNVLHLGLVLGYLVAYPHLTILGRFFGLLLCSIQHFDFVLEIGHSF
jgi:hypothetical protein